MKFLLSLFRPQPKPVSRRKGAPPPVTIPSAGAGPGPKACAGVLTTRKHSREVLLNVIRDAMTAAGVLSSAYKFKVLDLGKSGKRFAVLMHLDREPAEGAKQQIFVESVLKRMAATRHGVQVDIVYWHIGEAFSRKPRSSPLKPLATQDRQEAGTSDFGFPIGPLSNTQYGELA